MPNDTLIRQRIAELIDRDGRSQVELARASGVGQKTISAIVTGDRADLRAEVVARVARAVGLSPEALGGLLYECFPQVELDDATSAAITPLTLEGRVAAIEARLGRLERALAPNL